LLFNPMMTEATQRPAHFWFVALGAAVVLAGVMVVLAGALVFQPRNSVGVHIQSDPTGAEVFVDGERVGTTPLTIKRRRHGWGHVRITHPSFYSWEWRGLYPASGELELDARLMRLGDEDGLL
jgi:hypothetical protein